MKKIKCMITVDTEALKMRAASNHVDTLIYGKAEDKEYGINRMMDIADSHDIKMNFFLDFAECEYYGDAILEVGRTIISRNHELHVHCHYDILEKIVEKQSWIDSENNYYNWYQNDDDAQKMIKYVTEKYRECAGYLPVAYRGGEYRFGESIIRALNKYGYKADLTYNYIRPDFKPITRQFKYENGIIEFPISILPERYPFNFNYFHLVPQSRKEFDYIIEKYSQMFDSFLSYYGEDAIVTLMMHSWSFMYNRSRFQKVGYIDSPNELMAEFYDCFLNYFKNKIEFITVTEALEMNKTECLKIVDLKCCFKEHTVMSKFNLDNVVNFVKCKSRNRNIIVWGKGWVESSVADKSDYLNALNIAYYISNDADLNPIYNGKPVHRFSDVSLSPDNDYVLVLAQPTYFEIRDSLLAMGFERYSDFYDITDLAPSSNNAKGDVITKYTCPICGSHTFKAFNAPYLRMCCECHSLDRTRTLAILLENDVRIDFLDKKILHISPTIPERKLFQKYNVIPMTLDIRPECKVDIVADLCNMPQIENEIFDIVLADCVLNHVYDDEKALSEISRVMKTKGVLLLYCMESGTLKNKNTDDPTEWYGMENYKKYKIGTFRHYGEVDLDRQLKKYFSNVQCFEKFDEVSKDSCKWFVCKK